VLEPALCTPLHSSSSCSPSSPAPIPIPSPTSPETHPSPPTPPNRRHLRTFFDEAPDWLQHYAGYEDWGAFHAAELPFVFGTTPEHYTATEQAPSQVKQQAWVSLADQASVEGLGEWPLFGAGGGVGGDGGSLVQYRAEAVEVTAGVFQDRCDLLDSLGWHQY